MIAQLERTRMEQKRSSRDAGANRRFIVSLRRNAAMTPRRPSRGCEERPDDGEPTGREYLRPAGSEQATAARLPRWAGARPAASAQAFAERAAGWTSTSNAAVSTLPLRFTCTQTR